MFFVKSSTLELDKQMKNMSQKAAPKENLYIYI